MTPNENDLALLDRLKTLSAEKGYSPAALLALAAAAADYNARAVIPNFGPTPRILDDLELGPDAMAGWPSWAAQLVPAGSRWQRLLWTDGSVTVRLVDQRALVIAARHSK